MCMHINVAFVPEGAGNGCVNIIMIVNMQIKGLGQNPSLLKKEG